MIQDPQGQTVEVYDTSTTLFVHSGLYFGTHNIGKRVKTEGVVECLVDGAHGLWQWAEVALVK